jgi:integrase
MPYPDIPGFMTRLRDSEAISAHALQLLILTAARSEETVGALWEEVDIPGGVWTIPANRMKARKVHRVPLSRAAIEVLEHMRAIQTSKYVFPGLSRPKMSGSTFERVPLRSRLSIHRAWLPIVVSGLVRRANELSP